MYLNWYILYRVNVHKRWLIKYGFAYLLKNTLLHSHSQRFFANVSLKFSNINNRRVTSAHVVILLSFMQLIEEYLLDAKRF